MAGSPCHAPQGATGQYLSSDRRERSPKRHAALRCWKHRGKNPTDCKTVGFSFFISEK